MQFATTSQDVRTLTEEECTAVDWNPKIHRLVTGGATGDIKIWGVKKSRLIAEVAEAHRGAVISVAIRRDGEFIASLGDDSTVLVIGTKTR